MILCVLILAQVFVTKFFYSIFTCLQFFSSLLLRSTF